MVGKERLKRVMGQGTSAWGFGPAYRVYLRQQLRTEEQSLYLLPRLKEVPPPSPEIVEEGGRLIP